MIVGEAHVLIKPETRLFRKDLEQQTGRATRGVEATVEAALDATGLRQKVQAAAATAGRGVTIDLPVNVDRRGFGGGGGGGGFGGGGGDSGDLGGDDARRASASYSDLASKLVGVAAAGGIAAAVLNLLKWPVLIGGAGAAAAALGALSAAVIAVAGALGPLVGLLGAVPTLLFAVVGAAGVVALAFRGVGDAVKAYRDEQKGAAETARQTAAEYESASRAQEAAADRVRDAIGTVGDSERRYQRTQRDSLRAQERLNDARREAVEELEDLRLSVEGAALAEQRAALRLRQAFEARAGLGADGRQVTGTDLADANLDVAEAELALREAQEARGDEQEKLATLEREGVEQSERVVDAREAAADAEESVQDALRGTQQAQEDLADAMRESTRATAELGRVGAESGDKFRDAMSQLTPATQSFVGQLTVLLDGPIRRLREAAAEGLFPGLEQALVVIAPLIDKLADPAGKLAEAVGVLAVGFADLLASRSDDIIALFDTAAELIVILAPGFLALAGAFVDIAVAATPMTKVLATMFSNLGLFIGKVTEAGRADGSLGKFFDKALETLRLVGSIVGNLAGAFTNIFAAAAEEGAKYLGQLDVITERFRDITGSARDSGALGGFFESMRPTVEALGRLLGDATGGIGKLIADLAPQVAPLIDQLRTDLLPALLDLVRALTDPEFLESMINLTTKFVEFLAAVGEPNALILLVIDTIAAFLGIIAFLLTDLGLVSDALGLAATAISLLGTAAAIITFVGFLSKLSGLQAAIGLVTGAAPAGAAGAAAGAAGTGIMGSIAAMGGAVIAGVALGIGLNRMVERYFPGVNRALEDFGGWVQEHVIEKLGDALGALGDFLAGLDELGKITLPGGFTLNVGKIFSDPTHAVGRAMGGPVEAFRPYHVNEGTGAAGILIPLVPGQVLTASQQQGAGVWGVQGDLIVSGATVEGAYETAITVIDQLRAEAFRQGVGP